MALGRVGSVDPDGSVESWTERLKARANRDRVPLTLLAYDDDCLLGAVSLIEHDMPGRSDLTELTPWIAGTYVAAGKRRQGVGTALMQHAAGEAARLGTQRLYLYTSTALAFYEGLGWRREFGTRYEGETVTVMSLDVNSPEPGPAT